MNQKSKHDKACRAMKEVQKRMMPCLGSFEEATTNATIPWGTLLEKMKARKPCADKVTPGDQGALTLKAITDYSPHQNANGNTIKEPVYTEDNPVRTTNHLAEEIGISDLGPSDFRLHNSLKSSGESLIKKRIF